MADKTKDRANVLILLVVAALLVSLGFFLKPTYLVVLAVSLALAVAWTPHSPLADSLALSGVRRFGSNYTRMRIWGSIAFLCANLGGGIILSLTSEKSVPAIISCSLMVALLISFLAPRLGRPRKASPLSAVEIQDAGPKLLNRYFVLVVGGAGIINGSHAFLYSFVSIYWKSIGIGDTTVGLLWAWAVVAEAFMFLFFTRLFSRHSATAVMALAGAGAILRWLAFPLIWPSGMGVIGFFAIQSLHSFSTALILIGVQKLIVETVPEERTGAAQGIAFFATGFSMAAFTLLSGPLYAAFGVFGFWAMIAVAVAGLVLVWMAQRLRSS